MKARRLALVPALLLLAACSSGEPVGTSQEIELEHDDSGTDATVAFTVTAVEQHAIDVLSDFDLDADDLAMTPYFVRYSIELVSGELGDYPVNPVMSFSDRPALAAEDVDGGAALSMQLIGGLDECPGLGDGTLAGLAVGESAEGCRVFLAQSADGLGEVSFGSLSWSVAPE